MTQITKYNAGHLAPIQERFINLTDPKTWELESSFALQAINKNSQLAKCDPATILSAVFNVAQFGLSLNPIQHQAYMVPFYNRQANVWEAVLMIGYQGIISKICATGAVRNVTAELVREGDEFEIQGGTENKLIHRRSLGQRGNVTHVYAVAWFPDGNYQFEVMDWKEVEAIRDTSQSWKSLGAKSIWGKHAGEMAKKTVIRRLAKYLPKNDDPALRDAVALDDRDFKPDYETVLYAEGLLRTSTFDDEHKARIEAELHDYSVTDMQNLITNLLGNQLAATEQYAPTQTDLAEEVQAKADQDEDKPKTRKAKKL